MTRENHHHWLKDCEKCSVCGTVRQNKHQMVNDICQVCGKGTYFDTHSRKSYKIVKIGNQVLMAENFAKNPNTGNSWAYEDNELNADKYGYLYDWETAKSVAPKGWHLPTREEWENVWHTLGGEEKVVYNQLKLGGESGFECLFAGLRTTQKIYNSLGASAQFWSSSAVDDKNSWYFKIGAYNSSAKIEKGDHSMGMSIRLFKDNS
jgi:uncharacterized protein (TIGR02145 family)